MIKRLLYICLMLFTMAGNAHAQLPEYERNISDNIYHVDHRQTPHRHAGAPGRSVIALVRKPDLAADQFVLRVSDRFPVSGCATVGNYGQTKAFNDIYLDIEIEPPMINSSKKQQYTHLDCDRKSQIPVGDVVLSKTDLVKNNTKTIRLHAGNSINYYKIELTDDYIALYPDTGTYIRRNNFGVQKLPGRNYSLIYWFYPMGTVILWAPDMDKTKIGAQKNITKLNDFAQSKGLAPLETMIPGFQSPLTDWRFQYFVDTGGQLDLDDPDLQYGKVLGNIFAESLVYGLENNEMILDEIPIYAKIPGMYE